MALDANYPNQAVLPIRFVVVGGGIAGLACAIALRRVGHEVIVLEKSPLEEKKSSGGCRIPPNLSKIFYHWGLEKDLQPISFKSQAVTFQTFEEGEFLGQHVWDQDMLRETRGEFVFTRHADLWTVLYRTAVECGAVIRMGAEVESLDPMTATARLKSGETVQGSVIVGADGVSGVTRGIMLDEDDEEPVSRVNMYSTIIPASEVAKHDTLSSLEKHPLVYIRGKDPILRFIVTAPRMDKKTSESRLQELSSLAGDPGAIQESAMTIEDGAVLAKLFSHLHSEDQISSFLFAYQDLRQPRCNRVARKELADIQYMMLPPSELQEMRNSMMKAKHAAGLNVLAATEDMEESSEWAEIMDVFAYDAEDEADNWWVEWGLLRDRAKACSWGSSWWTT
ncbi:hypothetical protein BDQ17DRAFT_1323993 [Cyathus striatus]|nr:hypothetical protein BDQ17DRAFT_1323993 [Cyathus striatus]